MRLRRIAIFERLFLGVLNIGLMSVEGHGGMRMKVWRKGRTG